MAVKNMHLSRQNLQWLFLTFIIFKDMVRAKVKDCIVSLKQTFR